MLRVSAVYPNSAGSRFDGEYYVRRHTPFARGLLNPLGLRDLRITLGTESLDGAAPPYWAISELTFDDREAFDNAMAACGEALFADAPPLYRRRACASAQRTGAGDALIFFQERLMTRNFVRHEMDDIGQLIGLDELLNHQIVDTFSSTATADHGWTEKIWTALVRKDGTLSIDFGLGRYHNRGVLDGWAAVARGNEQWTVRASRELRDDPTITQVGPLTYEIIEPLHKVRYALAKNDSQPIAFDITFTSEMPPFFEDRHKQRENYGFRIGSDVVRYHQVGAPSGWVEIDGERIEINPEEWTEYRDHSWGQRLDVGAHNADVRPTSDFGDVKFGEGEFVLIWSPFMLTAPNGDKHAHHFYFMSKQGRIFYSPQRSPFWFRRMQAM